MGGTEGGVVGESDGEGAAAGVAGTGLIGPTVGLDWSGDAQPAAITAAAKIASAFFSMSTTPIRDSGRRAYGPRRARHFPLSVRLPGRSASPH